MTKIRICVAGATGWAGSALSRGIYEAPDMDLVAATSRNAAGHALGEFLNIKELSTPIFATATEALKTKPDVFVEFTKPDVAKSNVLAALQHGAHVVIGTSGLTDADYEEIAAAAEESQTGSTGGWKFCAHRGTAGKIFRDCCQIHPPLGDHRLRRIRQGRCTQRHCT